MTLKRERTSIMDSAVRDQEKRSFETCGENVSLCP